MLSSRRARPASGAATARLGSKQRPRAWRAEAARAGRWWPWHDSNGVTLFAQQFDRGICCELLLYKYLVPGTWYVWSPYHTKKMKCSILHRAAHTILHSYKEVPKGSHKQKGQNVSISEPNKYFEIWHNNRPITNALTQLTFVHVTYVCGIAAHGYSNVTYVTCTFVVRTLVRGIGGDNAKGLSLIHI